MSTFMQYAMAASSEALEDAGWSPSTGQQQEMTVSHESSNVKCQMSNGMIQLNWKIREYVWALVLEV